ncbi:hypothetical protein [Flavobacterium sp. DG2-3]|uniref:hypothetical protein n=1 Tax=Flavobacterium sp. DG2-3 TaxID=3068317 RepID=UPI00273EB4AE|nr:hypothetical protein [Flavobacterium sp. DG2-3]MDP5200866.1 hypothetical protein [Flavobacterium sp. DG2-3]
MHTIKQRRLFTKREYNILDNKLHYKTSYIGGEAEGVVAFENLTKEKVTHKTTNPVLLVIAFLILGMAGISFILRNEKDADPDMWIVFSFMSIVMLSVYLMMNENSWKIKTHNGGYLYLFKKKPNEKIVDGFIETLFSERDNYLIDRYLNFDPNLNEIQANDLKWLLNVEAISKKEFDRYYLDLKLLYAPKNGNIGF